MVISVMHQCAKSGEWFGVILTNTSGAANVEVMCVLIFESGKKELLQDARCRAKQNIFIIVRKLLWHIFITLRAEEVTKHLLLKIQVKTSLIPSS